MEFGDVKWQAQRVAAAFRIQEWQCHNEGTYWGTSNGQDFLVWELDTRTGTPLSLMWGNEQNPGETVVTQLAPSLYGMGVWLCDSSALHPHYNELMTHGLYRLGIEDEDVLAELNSPLTDSEKLELRLSMPREFWPQKWSDEEKQ